MINTSKLIITPVILCGGYGERLWPLSRKELPKQFLSLSGEKSLFQQTIKRLSKLITKGINLSKPIIITNEEHRFLVLQQLKDINHEALSIILESSSRNTAPALTLAALEASRNGDDPILVVMPSDQIILDGEGLNKSLQNAIEVAKRDSIVTLGIFPDSARVGFGYIQFGEEKGIHKEHDVKKFTEKPTLDKAKRYIKSGNYFWNSGIFILRSSLWINALKFFNPKIHKLTKDAFKQRAIDGLFVRPSDNIFKEVPSISIDYAVMEKCPASKYIIKVIPLKANWCDLGSWDLVWLANHKDDYNNYIHGDVLFDDTSNSLIYSSGRMIGVIGVKDLIVVETSDAILVADKNSTQHIKTFFQKIESQDHDQQRIGRIVYRPWGFYEIVDFGKYHQVKKLHIKPKSKLSVQLHKKRAEHWVVVLGTATVTKGDEILTLKKGDSIYISVEEIHSLENLTDMPLKVIEVQSGIYLGEDDIVRFEDRYGRMKSSK